MRHITITWQLPLSNGGSPITAYQVIPHVDGVAQPPRTSPPQADHATMTGLTRGQPYSFTVTAINQLGVGIPSAATWTVKA